MRWLFLLLALACNRNKPDGPAAPVTDGGYLVYAVREASPGGSIEYKIKLSFKAKSGGYEVAFESTGPEGAAPPVNVDRALVPGDNVITAFELGRLWLPPEARAEGKRTPCGVVSVQRRFKQWDVFAVDGACAMAPGIRFYEAATGMLVGFQFPGASEINAHLETSG